MMRAMSSSLSGVFSFGHRGGSSRVSRDWTCPHSSRVRPRVVASSASTVSVPEEREALSYREHLFSSVDLWSTKRRASLPGGGTELDASTEPKFTLTYMPMRNRAEVCRLILEDAGCHYNFDVVGFETWQNEVKPAAVAGDFRGDFGKLPVLVSHDKTLALPDGTPLKIGQETAITRFLAKQCGVAGNSDMEEARLDSLFAFYFATFRNDGTTHAGDKYSADALADEAEKTDTERLTRLKCTSYRASKRVNTLSVAERSLSALCLFEEILEKSESNYLLSRKEPSYVDLALLCELLELAEEDHVPDFSERFDLPNLGKLLEVMKQRPGIDAYLNSPRRMPRYERPGYNYIQ